ncbi:tRNA methyltransferase complex GCD14 subunit-domain-containing protein [Globomyces pollinis-pini]|nr:tRNA methyltransferase complex GCD14 subunit-domain-containing protein [Globomyces pollinis-pini]
MSFINRSDSIALDDVVIAYSNPNDMKPIYIQKDGVYTNRHGTFRHNDLIGKKWGTKAGCAKNAGFIFLLYPTPELWTMVLPHRTQILYQPDISLISTFLKLEPGVNMIEAGTGSGSFSHSIARTIAPNGKLFTFEYHEERVSKATNEFKKHGYGDIIKITHRDVCKDGFGLENQVQAVFLDLPSPWEALPSAKVAFSTSHIGRICCFSPCIEQVQRTCAKLEELKFTEIQMFEVLSRPHEFRKVEAFDIPTDATSIQKKRKLTENDPGVYTSRIATQVRGHTSYLTFATLLPDI